MRFEDEDPEERLDRHDAHISAVLSRIIVSHFILICNVVLSNDSIMQCLLFVCLQERDTSSVPVSLPCITGVAFPKVLHRSVMESEVRKYYTCSKSLPAC